MNQSNLRWIPVVLFWVSILMIAFRLVHAILQLDIRPGSEWFLSSGFLLCASTSFFLNPVHAEYRYESDSSGKKKCVLQLKSWSYRGVNVIVDAHFNQDMSGVNILSAQGLIGGSPYPRNLSQENRKATYFNMVLPLRPFTEAVVEFISKEIDVSVDTSCGRGIKIIGYGYKQVKEKQGCCEPVR
jgi:hypothetical protein